VRIERNEDTAAPGFAAQHDGYLKSFGLWHERGLTLRDEGNRLEGYDRLITGAHRGANAGQHQFDIRFHLHPAIHAEKDDHRSVRLATDQGELWRFTADSGDVTLEDSIHFAGVAGPVRTRMVLISGIWPQIDTVEWTLRRFHAS
jgi:uncharacterized heparinase superfamily protein